MKTIILKLDTTDTGSLTKVVKTVHMEMHLQGQKLYVPVPLPEPGEPFVAFSELTEQQVVDWCQSVLGEDKIQALEARLQEKVDAAATTSMPQPWEAPIGLEDNEDS